MKSDSYLYVDGECSAGTYFRSYIEVLLFRLTALTGVESLNSFEVRGDNVYTNIHEDGSAPKHRSGKEKYIFFSYFMEYQPALKGLDSETKSILKSIKAHCINFADLVSLPGRLGNRTPSIIFVYNKATWYPILRIPSSIVYERAEGLIPLSATSMYRLNFTPTDREDLETAFARSLPTDKDETFEMIDSFIDGIKKNLPKRDSYAGYLLRLSNDSRYQKYISDNINLDLYTKE